MAWTDVALVHCSHRRPPLPPAANFARCPCFRQSCACSGVEVDFPYEAYPCQLDYMGKVIEALQQVRRWACQQ